MKKLLLLALIPFMGSNAQAQTQQNNLFDIWEQAIEHVDVYEFLAQPNRLEWNEKRNITWDFQKKLYSNWKQIATDIVQLGFKFDPQNDTLLFVFGTSAEAIGSGPMFVYAQSKKMKQSYRMDFSGPNDRLIIDPNTYQVSEPEIPIIYAADMPKFELLFRLFGAWVFNAGSEMALRIVLKNGAVVSPASLWFYDPVPIEFSPKKHIKLWNKLYPATK